MDAAHPIQATTALAAQPAVTAEPRAELPDSVFRAAFKGAPTAMSICHLDGRIVEANEAMAHLLGCESEELKGSKLRQFTVPDSAPNSLQDSEFVEIRTAESRFRCRDGSEFRGRITTVPSEQGRSNPSRWRTHGNGDSELVLALLEDVSEHRQLEEALRQSEKMEVIGRLAAGIAHDFNNLLTGIFLYSDLLLAELPPDTSHRRFVEELQLASQQGSALTKQLMAVLRKQSSGPGLIAVNDVIAAMERLLRHMIGEQIELLTALDPAAGTIVADEGELRQVVLNLVLNARDALDRGRVPGGKIRVSTHVPSAEVIQLTIEDNGCGMTPDIHAHLFEPLFTTKKAGEGTGLGLATVKRIIDETGGRVEVATAPGCGSRIQVFLPSAQRSSELAVDAHQSIALPQVVIARE